VKWIKELIDHYPMLSVCVDDIEQAYLLLETTFKSGGKLLICGNGGSAADASHMVGELMKGFVKNRKLEKDAITCEKLNQEDRAYLMDNLQNALPAISLTGEDALITAYMNDAAPDMIYAQQIWGYGQEGDLLVAMTTSGNSENVIRAVQAAAAKGMKILSLTGYGGGRLKELADVCICVPETQTYRIQELHLPVYHTLCLMAEEHFF